MNKKKMVIIGAVIFFALALAGVGYWLLVRQSAPKPIANVDLHLTDTQRAEGQKAVADLQGKIKDEKDDQKRLQLYLNLGDQYQNYLGELSNAKSAYEQALNINPNSYPALNRLAALALQNRDDQALIRYLQKLIEVDPANKAGYQQLLNNIPKK